MVALASPVVQLDDADAKRKRRYSPPPLKILDISTSPTPFAPGNGTLAIMIDVELPKNLSNVDLLEVSSMISFPSKRSIRFLYSRQPIEEAVVSGGTPKIRTTLLWDGKDQTNQWVSAGTYKYEIRAKLMANTDGPPRTKRASLRVRGEIEVSSPESLTNIETHLEHVPFTSDDTPQEELGAGSDALETSEVEGSDSEDNAAQEGALKGAVTGDVKASVSATQ